LGVIYFLKKDKEKSDFYLNKSLEYYKPDTIKKEKYEKLFEKIDELPQKNNDLKITETSEIGNQKIEDKKIVEFFNKKNIEKKENQKKSKRQLKQINKVDFEGYEVCDLIRTDLIKQLADDYYSEVKDKKNVIPTVNEKILSIPDEPVSITEKQIVPPEKIKEEQVPKPQPKRKKIKYADIEKIKSLPMPPLPVTDYQSDRKEYEGKFDLNKVTDEQLKTISELTELDRLIILKSRRNYGDFRTINELANLPGMKSKFNIIKKYFYVRNGFDKLKTKKEVKNFKIDSENKIVNINEVDIYTLMNVLNITQLEANLIKSYISRYGKLEKKIQFKNIPLIGNKYDLLKDKFKVED
jgi:DNA uptake protein ComE-like DNA-binding protein